MPIGKKIRVYDLARELKQDTKRVMEDLRREGADISVPSNSVSAELAEKVRLKYFPKADPTPKRAIKIIKAAVAKKEPDHTESEPIEQEATPVAEVPETAPEPVVAKPAPTRAKPAVPAEAEEPKADRTGPSVRKVLKKRPVEVVEEPEPEVIEETVEVHPEPVEESEAPIEETVPEPVAEEEPAVESAPAEAPAEAPKGGLKLVRPGGSSVKKLTLTSDALKQGVKPGERVVSEQPTKTGKLMPDARTAGGRPGQFRGTPGETSTPQLNYTPPADNRRRPGRSGGRKGKGADARGGRFAERDIDQPRQRTIEERVMAQVARDEAADYKQVRLVEGATVREFSEALGITPRDIVQLLIKRGVFATLNQPIGEKMAMELGMDFGFDVSFVPFEEMVVEQEFEELDRSRCGRCRSYEGSCGHRHGTRRSW
jgi:translation initiation factor IF-2